MRKTKNYALRITHQVRKKFWPHRSAATAVDVLTGYAHWAKNYPPTAHNPLMQIEEQAMLNLLPDDLTGLVCLDLACGSGRYLLHLQARHAGQTVGVDYSAHMLAEANKQLSMNIARFSVPNHSLSRTPFFPLPFIDCAFDLITCGLAVGHEKNLFGVLAEIARVLRPGGIFIYSDFHPLGTLTGWQRSFTTDDGAIYNLEHHLHLYSHHQQACRAAGLVIDAVLEPLLGDAVPKYQNVPAVLVIRAVRR